MYLHKENRELFRDAILLASQKLEVSEDIVEKDYYVTLILKKLSTIEYPVVFKGGTSLSKAFHVIDRFSEDIDITFTEHLGEARRKKLKYNISLPQCQVMNSRTGKKIAPLQGGEGLSCCYLVVTWISPTKL